MPGRARKSINSTGGKWEPNTKPLDTIAAAKARALRAVIQCEFEPRLTVLEKSFYRRLREQLCSVKHLDDERLPRQSDH